MTSIPYNEGIMLATSQLVFAFILWFDQIVDRNHDLPRMMRVFLTISPQERYCLL
jgi:hypothetical protein